MQTPDIDGDVNLRLRLSLRVQGFVPPDTSGDEELPSAPATSVGVHHGVADTQDHSKLPTEFIIKGERLTTLIGLGDDVPAAALDFVQTHGLSESLLHTIERELWTTQLELSRRFIADRETDIEKLNHQNEMSGMAHQKAQGRISELETALASERSQHDGLEAHAREASKGLCAILGTSFGGEGSDSVPSLKQLVEAVAVRHETRESKIAAVERESEVLREQQGQSEKVLKVLKQNLEAVKTGLDEAKQHARQSELQAIEHHQAVLQERDAHAGRLQAQCDALSTDLEQRMAALDAAQEAALRAEQVAEDYAKKHELLKHNVREVTSQKQTWEAQISTLQHENKQLKQKVDEREVHNQKLQARVLDATTELRKLQRAIGTALATATATGQRVTILEGALRGAVDVDKDGSAAAGTLNSYAEMTGFASPRRALTTPRPAVQQQQQQQQQQRPDSSRLRSVASPPASSDANPSSAARSPPPQQQQRPELDIFAQLTEEQQLDMLKSTVSLLSAGLAAPVTHASYLLI
jgi:DNA repair exonuclease SbcCD ATPase subunit